MKLTELQAKAQELVLNAPVLAGAFVVADTGRIDQDVENALVDDGFAVVVGPVLDVQRIEEAQGTQLVRASFIVELHENPEQNSSHAAIEPLEAAVSIVDTVTAFRAGAGDSRFELGATPIELVSAQPGLRVYIISFSKVVQLS